MSLKEYKRQYYLKHRERLLREQLEYRKKNREKRVAYGKIYRATNPEKVRAGREKWRKANRAWKAKWDKENLHRHRGYMATRKSAMLNATPKWANKFFIEETYHLASLRTKILGHPWEVDHIVPLKSEIVCGLHVESNLRVVPAEVNLSKGNRHWPDMP